MVIGIYIALQLNNSNELRKTNLKVEALLEEVFEELQSNIDNCDDLINFYNPKDSLIHVVLNDKLSYDDYSNPNVAPGLFPLTTAHRTNVIHKAAFDKLSIYLDVIPSEYDSIVNQLIHLQTSSKKTIDTFNERMVEIVSNNIYQRSKNYNWFSYKGPRHLNEGSIRFMLDDYLYKNEVKMFRIYGLGNHLKHSTTYRAEAVAISQKLATLLNKPYQTDIDKYPELAKALIGHWESEQQPDFSMNFVLKNKQIIIEIGTGYSEKAVLFGKNNIHFGSNFGTINHETGVLTFSDDVTELWKKVSE